MKTYHEGLRNRCKKVCLYEDFLVELMEADLTASEQKVLFWLMFNPGVCRMEDIAKGIMRSAPLVTKGMRRLKRMNLVQKVEGRYYVSPGVSWPSVTDNDAKRQAALESVGLPLVSNTTLEKWKEKFIREVESHEGEAVHTAWPCEPPF